MPRHLDEPVREGSPSLGNPAPVSCEVHPLILERWSRRAFAERPVPPEARATLFEAARWAPSSFNEQPWAYFVASETTYAAEVDKIRFLAPGVALAHARWKMTGYVSSSGDRVDDVLRGILSMVLTKREDAWRICALQNTVTDSLR